MNLEPPWPRYTIKQAISHFAAIDESRLDHVADLAAIFDERKIPLPTIVKETSHPALQCGSRSEYEAKHAQTEIPEDWYGCFLMELFEETVEEKLQEPTFIIDYPVAVSPLAKPSPEDPRFTERFELYLGAMRLPTPLPSSTIRFSRRSVSASRCRPGSCGDEEAHRFDHDYIRALEHGMPPAGGEGIGIDRLTMLLPTAPLSGT